MRRRLTGGQGVSYKHIEGEFDPHSAYMNMARARRRWKQWERYTDRCIKLCGEHAAASRGLEKAYDQWARYQNHKLRKKVDKG